MNLEQLQNKLLAAARTNPPGDRVPYAFGKRIMARLKETPALDLSALWARALWRAAAPCVALTVLLGVWSFLGAKTAVNSTAVTENEDFSQHFEQTMLATLDETNEDVW
jgi:hypothetical protein